MSRLRGVYDQAEGSLTGGPTVSVVIPIRNRWNALFDCVRSLADQDHRPLEVIVVDDGSIRPIPAALQQWNPPYALHFLKTQPLGISAARNAGLAVARGDVIVLTDSDCVFGQGCLLELVKAVIKRPGDLAFQLRFAAEDRRLVWFIDSLAKGAKQKILKTPCGHIRYLDTGGFAIRRAYVETHSPLFNLSDLRGADTSLLARLYAERILPCFVESAYVQHHPVQSLQSYLLRHIQIGYFTSPARARLRASTDFLLTGARRVGVLRSAWTDSSQSLKGRLAFLLMLAAYGLEVLGRIAHKAVGMIRLPLTLSSASHRAGR